MKQYYYSDENQSMVKGEQLINEPHKLKPHVVILGAGASKQAFPHGDAKGKMLPVMDDLIEIVGLQPFLKEKNIEFDNKNFEMLYDKLYNLNSESKILKIIKKKIYNYFDNLEIPEEPTLYDHLLLSLREKDVIATFNWDPFLFDAWERIQEEGVPIPTILHLHGSVRIGYCRDHGCWGRKEMFCPDCERTFIPTKLLYPIASKNYGDDFLKTQWECLEYFLSKAFTITIFGYGAPTSDQKAVDFMEKAWKAISKRQLGTTEFIDIKTENLIYQQWKPFIPSQHFLVYDNFYKSHIANHPRRSCEALYCPTILGKSVEKFPIPKHLGFCELFSWLRPFINAERQLNMQSKK